MADPVTVLPALFQGMASVADSIKKIMESAKKEDLTPLLIELSAKIAGAYSLQIQASLEVDALVSARRDLEAQIEALHSWTLEMARYELQEPHPGSFLYVVKDDLCNQEPLHSICPKCKEDKIKSIMQAPTGKDGMAIRKCPRCDLSLRTHPYTPPNAGNHVSKLA